MDLALPYKSEYAKSGRASCKMCKCSIAQGSLRLAAMVQSAFHDGKQPMWFHEDCFFKKQRPQSVGDIENFENIRFEDQERIKLKIEKSSEVSAGSSAKKGKKRGTAEVNALKDFGIEYAKTSRATCRGCEQKILKDQVRIKKTVYDTEVGMKYGGQPLWHHVECFVQLRSELGWFGSGDCVPGFKGLKRDDQTTILKLLPAIDAGSACNIKKVKIEPDVKIEEEIMNKQIENQSKRLFKLRDLVVNQMHKKDIIYLLEYNNQKPANGDSERMLNQLADMLTFGSLLPCPQCKSCEILFSKSGYLCNGQLTEWTKCSNILKNPERKPCKVPKSLKEKYAFLSEIKNKTEHRIVKYNPPSIAVVSKNKNGKTENEPTKPKVKRETPPLYNLKFAYVGPKEAENKLKTQLNKLGGEIISKLSENIVAVFSSKHEVEHMGSRMKKAKELGIHIIPIDYLDLVESNPTNAINYISSTTLCDWGTDPNSRIVQEEANTKKSKSIYTKSVAKSMTLKIKDGSAVDPESGLQDVAHVYLDKNCKYSVVLGLTDIQRNKNSYYKLQLLESDSKNKYWVFRSWGRIGTTIGDQKLENFENLYEAKQSFLLVYHDKTGNDFTNREHFIKVPGRMYPIEIDYEEQKTIYPENFKIKSKLNTSVQSLIKILFDVDTMKRTMMMFDLDMEKMPLGKLSEKQIQSAYKVLSEIYDLIQQNGMTVQFIDATNRFYTLIPHNFGVQNPPILDNIELVEKHRQVLDSLLEIECAYGMLQAENKEENVNPLDKHYDQLKTKLDPIDKNSEEYKILEKYVRNTHAETHKMYKLEIVEIFKVVRQGENRRYKPFKKLENRKLLWHGSRLTNFAGILSHGLKIAPPEAPVTGYMFGKGIYFADMVSKSANYCCTTAQDSTGLMILSEVALGNMLECTSSKYITKLPSNKHSTLGRGQTMPDPKDSYKREDGVEIPLGKPITDTSLKTSLLYNEYIVYDVAQVNIQYLFRMNFKYNI
ncbi:poly [ADP-ribose] polymerase isoform X1 [Bactrocera neohumeralis]|uniref:poly [ADP-ribose] polymerase isoform X1 n=1 Tax=Bactrocera tryoni TaxID=59916 RepID=UPI001A97AE7F|nr:poly [ADP-ribose] polymerase isoform X1 [Bactrocera tryoni]XP_050338071.1 poly [ADP-ribose] polymerase isoform X1 [Bactrocera neohumeralis]